jgi:hypothetical protein
MPNWCEGTLRIRGKVKDIIQMFFDNLEIVTYTGENARKSTPIKDDVSVYWNCEARSYFEFYGLKEGVVYFKDSKRLMVNEGEFEYRKDELDEVRSCAMDVQQAWRLDVKYLAELSGKYNLEMKITGFELGQEMVQRIYVKNGEVLENEEIEYEDWYFDCICPRLGG